MTKKHISQDIASYIKKVAKEESLDLTSKDKHLLFDFTQQYYPDAFSSVSSFIKEINEIHPASDTDEQVQSLNLPYRIRIQLFMRAKAQDAPDADELLDEHTDTLLDIPSPEQEKTTISQKKHSHLSDELLKKTDDALFAVDSFISSSTEHKHTADHVSQDWLAEMSRPINVLSDWDNKVSSLRDQISGLTAKRKQVLNSISDSMVKRNKSSTNQGNNKQSQENKDYSINREKNHKTHSYDQINTQALNNNPSISAPTSNNNLNQSNATASRFAVQTALIEKPLPENTYTSYMPAHQYDTNQLVTNQSVTDGRDSHIYKERELDRREESLLMREQLVERKQLIISKGITSLSDPLILQALSLIDSHMQEAESAKRQLFSYQKLSVEKGKEINRKEQYLAQLHEKIQEIQENLQQLQRDSDQRHHELHEQIDSLTRKRDQIEHQVTIKKQQLDGLMEREQQWLETKEKLLHQLDERADQIAQQEQRVRDGLEKIARTEQDLIEQEQQIKQDHKQRSEKLEEHWRNKQLAYDRIINAKQEEIEQQQREIERWKVELEALEQRLHGEQEHIEQQIDKIAQREKNTSDIEKKVLSKLHAVQLEEERIKANERSIQDQIESVKKQLNDELVRKTHQFESERERILNRERELTDKLNNIRANEESLMRRQRELEHEQEKHKKHSEHLESKERQLEKKERELSKQLYHLKDVEKQLEKNIGNLAVNLDDIKTIKDDQKEMEMVTETIDQSTHKEESSDSIAQRIHLLCEFGTRLSKQDGKRAREIYRVVHALYHQLPNSQKPTANREIHDFHRVLMDNEKKGESS